MEQERVCSLKDRLGGGLYIDIFSVKSKKRVFWVYLGHILDFGPEKKIWNMDLYHLGHFLLKKF